MYLKKLKKYFTVLLPILISILITINFINAAKESENETTTTNEILSFPGAEGYGRFSKGGSGGDVYHVTNLKDSGSGSLREGINSSNGPRTIVFDVSGNIRLESSFIINKDNITIAGQTAPKGGITVYGYNTLVKANNVIIRFMRFRCGDFNVFDPTGVKPPRGNANLKGSNADAISVIDSNNVIFDHISASWSVDEALSVTKSNNVTVQNSIISEPLNDSYLVKNKNGLSYLMPHGFGSLVRANNNDEGGYTYYRNLYAHNDMRNPGVGPYQPDSTLSSEEKTIQLQRYKARLDFVNNIVYGWGQRQGESIDGSKGGRAEINMVNNYYIANKYSDDPSSIWDDEKFASIYAYQSGNKVDSNVNGILDGKDLGWDAFPKFDDSQKINTRWNYPLVTTYTPNEAYNWVKNYVGSSLSRDKIDSRIINELVTNTGSIIDSQDDVGGLPAIPSIKGGADTDRDGIPDAWEDSYGLNKNNIDDRNNYDLNDDYTNLEVYLNSLLISGTINYKIGSSWNNSTAINVIVKNTGSQPIKDWEIDCNFSENQKITSSWCVDIIETDSTIRAKNVNWNSTIEPGSSVEFGFILTNKNSNSKPNNFILNTSSLKILLKEN
ncbi:MAG: cellulose binding domain-containing protein [Clostridiales bacterium]